MLLDKIIRDNYIRKVLLNIGLSLFVFVVLPSTGHSQINYSTQIQPILDSNCTSCHDNAQSGVTLTSYQSVMNSVGDQYEMNIVVPEEPDNSPLVDKIEPNPQYGSQMPQGSSLTEAQIDTIRQWIAEGAEEEPAMAIGSDFERPETLKLHGNYPNPFNPATIIKITVDQTVDIQLSVSSINGKLIQTKSMNSVNGNVSIPVSLTNRTSGLYLYKISAYQNNRLLQKASGRMLLIK